MAGQTFVILGGGVGGLVTANVLRKQLSKEHRIVLIDREGRHVFYPSLLWVQVDLREPGSLVRDLKSLERKGIEVVKGEVEAIEPERKMVRVGGRAVKADYLVISLGAEAAPEMIPGLTEAGYCFCTLEGVTAIKERRKSVNDGKLVVLTARTPYKCPAAPYETAMLLDYDLRKRKVRDHVEIAIYAAEPAPMGVAGPEASQGVRHLVEERDIAYYPQHQVTGVNPKSKTLRFGNGAEAQYDFLVYAPPHVVPPPVQKAGLTDGDRWMSVDRYTMETKFAGVFAIGDITSIPLSMGHPLPKAGVFAQRQAEAVAQTIVARVTGKGESGQFDGQGECFVEVGGGKAGFGRGNFYAEPSPSVKFHQPTRYWHAGKILFEKDWFRRWF